MSSKILLRSVPGAMKLFKPNCIFQSQVYCNYRNALYNVTGTVHMRTFIKDASKYEVVEGRERIYYGVLTPQIRAVKWFSLTTSAAGLLAQPFLLNTLYTNQSVPLIIGACSVMGFFMFVTPILLHFITKKYVTHLDYDSNKQTYIASTVNFFCMLKETEFTPADVQVPDVPGMFTTCIAKGFGPYYDPRKRKQHLLNHSWRRNFFGSSERERRHLLFYDP